VVADLAAATACSAQRVGDAFGFIGANGAVQDALSVAPTRSRGWGPLIAERLRRHVPSGDSASGLLAAAEQLGRHRALVFLASDFHFPCTQLDRLLAALARHVVVPVVLWDAAEFEPTTRWGIEVLRDLESGQRRLLFMRPALRAKIALALAQRRRELAACWRRHGVRALWLPDGFEAARITQYFLDAHA
jgi:molybdopterin-guanine dinucleotide biosynthesis protein A